MQLFTPQECASNYAAAGQVKAGMPLVRMFLLAVLAGFFIAMGGAVTNTAAHTIANVGAARVLSGLLFPFGLAMVILTGSELFTGNTLMVISVLDRRISLTRMLRNWGVVYLGNTAGAMITAAACAFGGQLNYSGGELAVFTMKLAASKCVLPPANAVILGILCNILVTAGVLLSLSAKDLTGRTVGAYLPIAFFVICGFEHCIANLYYIPAGLFARMVPAYEALAVSGGVDLSALTWGGFLLRNLLPVTLGNILGGAGMGALYWFCHGRTKGTGA
ncbi:MAG: formate/nitrite transporter family protein [Oscillospiraceae bacterium]|jgi:formate/nitrite transporter|nr:formate/nitrite transporter family protein [Oscillospiraceae bacterium]